MPNWKKVIVSGSDAYLRNITASGDISASGLLHASLSFDTTPVTDGVVVYDTAGGRFYYTGSYGGGSGGTIVIKEDGVTTVAAATTIDFLNSIVTESPSGEANVAFDLQGVTDSGAVTSNGSLFLHNQNSSYGFSNSQLAKSGFAIDNSKAYTYATPQRTQNDVYLLGMHITANGVGPYPDNFITMNKELLYMGQGGPYDGGGGGTNPDTDHPNDLGGTLISTGTGFQVLASSSISSITKDNKARGIYITPSALYMFNTDASASISGTLIPESASAQIRFNTASSAIEFLAGATTEDLTKVLFISRSGVNPRVGIGTEDPKGVFDFKDIEESDKGVELLLRTSRRTKGADVGDDAGLINFTIDSSSFSDIETSGSVAQIAAKVLNETPDGVFGKLSFQVAESAKLGSTERFSLSPMGAHITGTLDISSYVRTTAQNNALGSLRIGSYASSIDSGDLSVQGGITLFSADSNALTIKNGSLHLENAAGSRGHITASGNISASGEIIADIGNFAAITSSNLQILGTASIAYFETLYETSSIIYSSGSTKFGDTMDDFHDFTGSVDITGSTNVVGNITASGDISASGDVKAYNFIGQYGTDVLQGSSGVTDSIQFNNRAHWRKSNAYISSRGNEWVLSGNGISEPNNYTEAYVHIAKEGGASKALSLDYSATGNKATFDIDTNGFLEIHPDGLSTHFSGSITASGNISVSGTIIGSNLSGTNTGDQDLSSYSTIVQLNASSSALQTNISTNTGNISTNTTNITSLTDTVSTVTTVIGSDAATNVDTFATSTYNGAIYDYILKDSTVGARAGQFMVAHDDGDVTFTDTSTRHLSDSTIPEITADISGGSTVRVRVTNGNGYTFKAFTKKL